jgi:hypothetical protein
MDDFLTCKGSNWDLSTSIYQPREAECAVIKFP